MTSFLLLESGDTLLLESGDALVLEDHSAGSAQDIGAATGTITLSGVAGAITPLSALAHHTPVGNKPAEK